MSDTSKIEHTDLPDNSFTIILKVDGKVYPIGGLLGDKISTEMADEDLESALRAINGASISAQRTLAFKIAKRDEDFELPNGSTEEDLTPPTPSA